MVTNKRFLPRNGGWEIAVNSKNLSINGFARILERPSTNFLEEVPDIEYPEQFAETNNLIQYDQPWSIEFNWVVKGSLACLLECGYWQCKVLFENIGGNETFYSPETTVQDLGIPGHQYRALITIPARKMKPGVYKVVCCTQYCLKSGSPGPIAGFEEFGLIKIFEDHRAKPTYPISNGQSQEESAITPQ